MEKVKLSALNELQSFMTYENVIKLKNQFVKGKLDPDEISYRTSDFKKGEYEYYDADKEDFVWIKFETELKKYLEQFINNLKLDIDNAYSLYSPNERGRYFKNIFISFNYIKDYQPKLLKLFPVCYMYFEEIENYLFDKYDFHNSDEQPKNSYFGIKPSVKKSDIEKVYDFLINNNYLDDEIISYEGFYSVLDNIETPKIVQFNCKTTIACKVLYEMQSLFYDFTPKSIEESARFISKGGATIKAQNLYSVKNRTKDKSNKDSLKIEHFFKESFSL